MKRELTCIICPKGCLLAANVEGTEVTVSGNACPRGQKYAIDECLHPVRTVTATVRVENRPDAMVSVRTQKPVRMENMADVMAALRRMTVTAPIKLGAVVAENVCGSPVIATKNIY